MLFNSYVFIFLFLPVSLFVYFFLNRKGLAATSKAWLVLASLFFYGWWDVRYLPLIMTSIILNYSIGTELCRASKRKMPFAREEILVFGIIMNLICLAYFKYVDFFIANINILSGMKISFINIVLPLGISFFTFTQIAFLIDAYRREMKEYSLLNYSLFVTFFPHLLAGPIIHHRDMMPQFDMMKNKIINYRSIFMGICLFVIGLFKKVLIADHFAVYANNGFNTAETLKFIEAWTASLSYTIQIYFDFSGYTDMALGIALLFNIRLPINFNSPYKSLNIQEFWRRWHITLSKFMRDYVYIPLGGNRTQEVRILFNLFITFLIGGLWHGAGWTFVIWGVLHGSAIVVYRLWRKLNINLPKAVSWFITFNFVNVAWVIFRAKSLASATQILKGMAGLNGIVLPPWIADKFGFLKDLGCIEFGNYLRALGGANIYTLGEIAIACAVVFLASNSNTITERMKPTMVNALLLAMITVLAVLKLSSPSEFIYFNF
jgi:D-alanyl-lipoteichoic acid acyltransferase DltB (MBOAT superfamily)